jgi:hypothetical protein
MNIIKVIYLALKQIVYRSSMEKYVIKFLSLSSLLIIVTASVFAQGHQQMSYQTIVKDADNHVVENTTIGMRISLLQGSETGDVVYQETQTTSTNANGLINIQIGSGKVTEGDFGKIDWAKSPYFIKTEINPSGAVKFKRSDKSLIVSCVLYASNPAKDAATAAVGAVSIAPSKPHYVGEFYGGGIIFYVNKDADGKEHGLVVGLKDLSQACVWSNVVILIGSAAESTFDGKANTKAIISQDDHKISAALLCDTSTLGDQTDWYLPSMQELNMLWNSLGTINKVLDSDGNPETMPLADDIYWSSTEDDATTFAWYFGMYDGGPNGDTAGTNYKTETYHVRAIRSF